MKTLKVKKEFYLLSVLIIGLILIVGDFWQQLYFSDSNYQLEKGERVEIVPGDILEQQFISNRNGLGEVGILFGGKPLPEGYFLELILADEKCQQKLRTEIIRGKFDFDSDNLYKFRFKPLAQSKSQKYCLQIVYQTDLQQPKEREVRLFANKASSKTALPAVRIKPTKIVFNKTGKSQKKTNGKNTAEKIDNEKDTAGVIDDKKVESEAINHSQLQEKQGYDSPIVFRPGYKNGSIWRNWQELNQRISQYKPWFLKGIYLDAIFVLMVGLSGYSIWLLLKK